MRPFIRILFAIGPTQYVELGEKCRRFEVEQWKRRYGQVDWDGSLKLVVTSKLEALCALLAAAKACTKVELDRSLTAIEQLLRLVQPLQRVRIVLVGAVH